MVPSILDYMGKYENGILVSIGLSYNQKFYNGIFYYTKDQMIICVDEKLEKDINCHIEEHNEYLDLLKMLINKVEPFENIYEKLNNISLENKKGKNDKGI